MEAHLVNPSSDELICTFDPMKQVIFLEDAADVTLEDFDGALDGIEEWIEECRMEKRTKLLEMT
ncbi:hypothetical protein FRB97_001936, partial [Tulasnella sp. 331]